MMKKTRVLPKLGYVIVIGDLLSHRSPVVAAFRDSFQCWIDSGKPTVFRSRLTATRMARKVRAACYQTIFRNLRVMTLRNWDRLLNKSRLTKRGSMS
jgi:hypothetical protein